MCILLTSEIYAYSLPPYTFSSFTYFGHTGVILILYCITILVYYLFSTEMNRMHCTTMVGTANPLPIIYCPLVAVLWFALITVHVVRFEVSTLWD